MNQSNDSPVVPQPIESEMAAIPGPGPGTALRVQLLGGPDGGVRLEQLAYSAALGWYVQKSFCVPGPMLADLITQLRKADCLNPRRSERKPNRVSRPDGLLAFPGPGLASKSA